MSSSLESVYQKIAQLSGESTTTVARVLENRPVVSPETRARILAVAERLGYNLTENLVQEAHEHDTQELKTQRFRPVVSPEDRARILAIAERLGYNLTENLVQEAHDPNTQAINAKKVAELLGITVQDMADILGVDRSVLTRHPTASKIQGKLGKLVGVIGSVRAELEGSLDHTRMWFRTGNRLLAGDTPLEALKQGQLEFLVAAVYRMESGDSL